MTEAFFYAQFPRGSGFVRWSIGLAYPQPFGAWSLDAALHMLVTEGIQNTDPGDRFFAASPIGCWAGKRSKPHETRGLGGADVARGARACLQGPQRRWHDAFRRVPTLDELNGIHSEPDVRTLRGFYGLVNRLARALATTFRER